MNLKSITMVWLIALAAVLPGTALNAAESARGDAAMVAKLIQATEKSDYAAFVADGETAFQRMTKEQFAAATAVLAPRLQVGYRLSYLGELKQRGYRVTLWKLTFKDGSDDALASLSMKEGKVGGFFIR